MWVVKLGGSLSADPVLADWLRLLTGLGGGRVAVVGGGGPFADEVRRLQRLWRFDDLEAHNMAVLAMAQTAWMFKGLQPALHVVGAERELPMQVRQGRTPVWAPHDLVTNMPDPETTHWGCTSDSIALGLARRLNAEQLVVVKSCEIDETMTLDQMVAAGILDDGFARKADRCGFPIRILCSDQLAEMRSLLLGQASA